MSYMSNLHLLMSEAGAKTKREKRIFMAGFQAGMKPENSRAVGLLAELAERNKDVPVADKVQKQKTLIHVRDSQSLPIPGNSSST